METFSYIKKQAICQSKHRSRWPVTMLCDWGRSVEPCCVSRSIGGAVPLCSVTHDRDHTILITPVTLVISYHRQQRHPPAWQAEYKSTDTGPRNIREAHDKLTTRDNREPYGTDNGARTPNRLNNKHHDTKQQKSSRTQ